MDEQRLQCCGFAASLNHYAPTVFDSPASPQFTAGVTEFTSNIWSCIRSSTYRSHFAASRPLACAL
jgi:hypothetical protein